MINGDLTYIINGCAMAVYNSLGNGFREITYQRALAIEFKRRGLRFAREQSQTIYYNEQGIGSRRVDFIVEDIVMVEIKAVIKIESAHLAQAINYIEVYKLKLGLLINFGAHRLEYRRIYNKKYNY